MCPTHTSSSQSTTQRLPLPRGQFTGHAVLSPNDQSSPAIGNECQRGDSVRARPPVLRTGVLTPYRTPTTEHVFQYPSRTRSRASNAKRDCRHGWRGFGIAEYVSSEATPTPPRRTPYPSHGIPGVIETRSISYCRAPCSGSGSDSCTVTRINCACLATTHTPTSSPLTLRIT